MSKVTNTYSRKMGYSIEFRRTIEIFNNERPTIYPDNNIRIYSSAFYISAHFP